MSLQTSQGSMADHLKNNALDHIFKMWGLLWTQWSYSCPLVDTDCVQVRQELCRAWSGHPAWIPSLIWESSVFLGWHLHHTGTFSCLPLSSDWNKHSHLVPHKEVKTGQGHIHGHVGLTRAKLVSPSGLRVFLVVIKATWSPPGISFLNVRPLRGEVNQRKKRFFLS